MTIPELSLTQLIGDSTARYSRGPVGLAIVLGAAMAITATGYGVSLTVLMDGATVHSHAADDTAHMMSDDVSAKSVGRPVTGFHPISCNKLPNVPGKSLTLAMVGFPPDAFTPRHSHPASVTAYVTKGTVRSQLEGEPAVTYATGQSWFEPPGEIHLLPRMPASPSQQNCL